MADLPHNAKANKHFKDAEGHAVTGRHKEMWSSLSAAQTAATNHARELAEGGQHSASLAYRKIVMGQVGDISRKLNKATDEFTMSRYSALSALWEVMKKEGPNKYKYAVPQIELAKTIEEIDKILGIYGIKLLKGNNEE